MAVPRVAYALGLVRKEDTSLVHPGKNAGRRVEISTLGEENKFSGGKLELEGNANK